MKECLEIVLSPYTPLFHLIFLGFQAGTSTDTSSEPLPFCPQPVLLAKVHNSCILKASMAHEARMHA